MKRFGVALLVVSLAVSLPAAALAASVASTADITNDGPADNGDNEVDIAVNPINPSNLIAAWNDYGPGDSCGLGYSLDGGQTWTTSWLHGVTPEAR